MEIRSICENDMRGYKTLRLEALRDHPTAFGSDYEEDRKLPDSFWIERIKTALDESAGRIFLADNGDRLAGSLGVYRQRGAKCRHQGHIWGVYVRPEFRGRRLTDRMMDEAVRWCRAQGVRDLRLAVS